MAVDVGVDDSDLTALEECVSDSQGSKGILLLAESERRLCASLCGGTGGTTNAVSGSSRPIRLCLLSCWNSMVTLGFGT